MKTITVHMSVQIEDEVTNPIALAMIVQTLNKSGWKIPDARVDVEIPIESGTRIPEYLPPGMVRCPGCGCLAFIRLDNSVVAHRGPNGYRCLVSETKLEGSLAQTWCAEHRDSEPARNSRRAAKVRFERKRKRRMR